MKRVLLLIIPIFVTVGFGHLGLTSLVTGHISVGGGLRNPSPIREVHRSTDPARYWTATGASLAAALLGLGLCVIVYRKTPR